MPVLERLNGKMRMAGVKADTRGPVPGLDAVIPEQVVRKIRILHSVGYLSRGGIETWLLRMIEMLDPDMFEHHVLVWTSEAEALTGEFEQAGARVLPCTGHRSPLRFARNFARILREQGPYDVLHTHGTHFHGFVMLLAKLGGIGVRIAHSHTDIRPVLREAGPVYRTYAAVGNRAIKALTTLGIGVTEEAAVSMFDADWRRDPRFRILHCGIDFRSFAQQPDRALRATLGLPADAVVVGHVGRFETQKNHSFLIDLAAEIVRRGAGMHFLLIGDGSLRSDFERTVRERELAHCFTILPETRDVPAYMLGAMDCFICPSLYEGLPLVVVEAQVAGLPCLVSDGTSHEAVIHPSLVQRLALSDGVNAWVDALVGLHDKRLSHDDPALRSSLERNSFNAERSAAGLRDAYLMAIWGSEQDTRKQDAA